MIQDNMMRKFDDVIAVLRSSDKKSPRMTRSIDIPEKCKNRCEQMVAVNVAEVIGQSKKSLILMELRSFQHWATSLVLTLTKKKRK